jgi:F-type H+-transporting ATPase subunit delta
MLTSKVAKRYAQGLLDFTQETKTTEDIFREMNDVVETIKKSKDLQNFLASPIIDAKKKINVAREIFRNFSLTTNNLVQLTIKHGRENQLQNICTAFISKVEDLKGVQRVTITSAATLSEENINNILKSTNLVNNENKLDVNSVINPEILGGYILRVGDQQVDSSVKSKLNDLKKEFVN